MKQTTSRAGDTVLICSDRAELVHEGAEAIVQAFNHRAADRFSIALSGGSTPEPLYEHLATRPHSDIQWDQVELFWGDERYVRHDQPESNYRMARAAMIDRIAIPPGNVHPIPTNCDEPEEAAQLYQQVIRRQLGDPLPRLDLSLLGLGDDGHTASLFPGSAALLERDSLVAATEAPAEPRTRITLTLPLLNRARKTIMLVAGAGKHLPLRAILDDPERAQEHYPAAMIRPEGELLWIVDRKAYEG